MIGLAYEELWLWMLVISLGILAVEVGILLCVWLGDRVRGFVYRWKHRNDPPPKVGGFGFALGALRDAAFARLIDMEIKQGEACARRGEPIFQTPGFFCYGCPELKNVRYCAICRLKRDEKKGEEK